MGAIAYTTKTNVAPTSWGALASGSLAASAYQTTDTSKDTTDVLITPKIVTGTFTASATTNVGVYVVGSQDGTTWPDSITLNSAFTLSANGANANNLFAAYIACPTSAGSPVGNPFSLAKLFGGTLPPYWAVVVQNNTGAALGSGSSFDFEQVSYS